MAHFDLMLHFLSLLLTVIHLCAKFKVYSFNCSFVQILALRKKLLGRTPKVYISPMWGEARRNLTVTKFCMWVPIRDVIICARFYLYCPNGFLGVDPRTLAVPIDLNGELYNSLSSTDVPSQAFF